MDNICYQIERQSNGLYKVQFNGVVISDELELHEAALMIETLLKGEP